MSFHYRYCQKLNSHLCPNSICHLDQHTNGIIQTIRIRADMIVFLRHWVHAHPTADGSVVMAGTVIVPVQTVHAVKLLAVVLVPLGGSDILTFAHQPAEGIVVAHLLNRSVLVHYQPVVTQMVPHIEVVDWRELGDVRRLVCRTRTLRIHIQDVSSLYERLLQGVILVDEVVAVVRLQFHTFSIKNKY